MSPSSSVSSWDRSATSRANGKSRSSVVSSWTSLAVVPGADPEFCGIHGVCGDQSRAHGGEAVAALGAEVGALVRVAEVVDAEVVAGGDPLDVAPGVLDADAAGRFADDQGDLAFVAEEFAAGGALHRGRSLCRAERQGGRRLQEVGGLFRGAAALGCPAGVVDVHRDDLAGRGQDVVGDLFQVLLLIEYEIVYDNYYLRSFRTSTPDFSGVLRGACNAGHTCVQF